MLYGAPNGSARSSKHDRVDRNVVADAQPDATALASITSSPGVSFEQMDKQTISCRLDAGKVSTLDTLAESRDRDRSYLLKVRVRRRRQSERG